MTYRTQTGAIRALCFVALLCCCLAASLSAQTMYRWVDADGNVQFSDRPPDDDVETEAMAIPGQDASEAVAASTDYQRAIVGTWCLHGISLEIDGRKEPDRSVWKFNANGGLHYNDRGFEIKSGYVINDNRLEADSGMVGNYTIMTISAARMILRNSAYYHFRKGGC